MKPKVYVIILNYNSWLDTIECVESVLKNDYSNFQVVVLDNNSSDNSLNYLKLWADGKLSPEHLGTKELNNLSVSSAIKKPLKYFYLTKKELQTLSDKEKKKIFSNLINFNKNQYYSLVFIQNEENKGFAAGNNKALELLLNEKKEGFIFLLNPDMVLTQDTISNLVECAVDKNAVYGLNVFDYHNPDQLLFKGGASLTPYGTIRFIKKAKDFEKLDYISGGAFFTHIENFRKVGLLPEEYFLYWEETDWCVKARKVGIKLKVCENAKCFDKGGVSIGRGSFLSEYYYTLNSLKFHKKYFPTKVKKIKIFSFARIAKRIIKGKFLLVKAIIKALKDFENEK